MGAEIVINSLEDMRAAMCDNKVTVRDVKNHNELYELLYDEDAEVREYVDKYCNEYGKDKSVALKDKIVQEYINYKISPRMTKNERYYL